MRLPNQTMVPFLAGLLLAGTSAFVAEEMRKRGIEDLIPSQSAGASFWGRSLDGD